MIKNKIGIFVCLLLIITAIVPVVNSITIKKEKMQGVIDQHQDLIPNIDWLLGGGKHYQEFVNQGKTLKEVQLHMGCYFSGSYDITIAIEKPLGSKITQVTLNANWFTMDTMKWYTINLPDKILSRGQNYFITVQFDPGSEYAWSGSYGNPYGAGTSSKDPDWDYAFRTIVDKSKNKNTIIEPKTVIDQKQEQCDNCLFLPNYGHQGFVPRGNQLLQVDLSIAEWYGGSPDLQISIEKPLGTSLFSTSLTVNQVPSGSCNWVSININPRIQLDKDEMYYIVLSYPPGGEYGWGGSYGDPYPKGTSDKDPDWDYAFRTIVDKSKPKITIFDIFQEITSRYPMINEIIKI